MVKSSSQRKDPAWKYGTEIALEGDKAGRGYKFLKCNFCSKEIKGGVKRMKEHLGCTRRNAAPCSRVPEAVKQVCLAYMEVLSDEKREFQRRLSGMASSGGNFGVSGSSEEVSCSCPGVGINALTPGTSDTREPMDKFLAIKTSKPLVYALRMVNDERMPVNDEKKPAMGFIYNAMNKAKEEIKASFDGDSGAYKEIWDIIDEKWDSQVHCDLHLCAYFLNPQFQYEYIGNCPNVKKGFYNCLERLIPSEEDRQKVSLQIDIFCFKRGFLGFWAAQTSYTLRTPVAWWTQFGDEVPELTAFAVKLLRLTCSASACEPNWNKSNQVHQRGGIVYTKIG